MRNREEPSASSSRGNTIRGPRSALTDYLQSQNISVRDLRGRNRRRESEVRTNSAAVDAAESTQIGDVEEDEEQDEGQNEEQNEEENEAGPPTLPAARQAHDRKRKAQAAAIEKIKKSKAFKRRKLPGKKNNPDDEDDDLAVDAGPVPGQTESCAICSKRFTVTAYSRAGPNGGLLCPKCSKQLAEDDKASKKKAKKKAPTGAVGGDRRRIQSQRLDGHTGTKSLATLCVETLASNIDLADDLGDLPPLSVNRIARRLSKLRLVNPHTLQLFLQPHAQIVSVYDAGRLFSDDFIRIFQVCSSLKYLELHNAIQFTDKVMKYLIGRHFILEGLTLYGANLISKACWMQYLEAKGQGLKELKVAFTDTQFNDDIVESLPRLCPSLTRLKIYHNQAVTDQGIEYIANIRKLEHLGLRLTQKTSTDSYIKVIKMIGGRLRTLSLAMVEDVDDRLLDAVHDHCSLLTKLRITCSREMTDAGFVRLFKSWNNKELAFLDLQLCRYIDANKPEENPHLIGLCSDGFRAIMKLSGQKLRTLNVHGCSGISHEAFEDVFSANNVYPMLQDLEISFCQGVTDYIVGSIFRSCPNLKKVNVFGCMKVRDVSVPKGTVLIGLQNSSGMSIVGD
ncbi:RNI-like protein [Hypoxylon sp. NC1633]|nr:RNI-like protein [Hypoxylon sp. NC1633]